MIVPFLPISVVLAENNIFSVLQGVHIQHSTLGGNYGQFLKDRYGIKKIIMKGEQVGFLVNIPHTKSLRIGLEKGSQRGEIRYKDLNGTSRTNDILLDWVLLLINYSATKIWTLGTGLGSNKVTRKFYGYKDNSIDAYNYKINSGQVITHNNGIMGFGQISYNFKEIKTSMEYLSLSYRYSYSVISVPSSDKRPALNTKGEPINSFLNTDNHMLLVQIGINF